MAGFVVRLLVVLVLLPAPAVLSAQQAGNTLSARPSVPAASSLTTVPPPQALEIAAEDSAESSGRPPKRALAMPRELSPWSMFLSADILVKAVMVGLTLASLATWTVFIAKAIELSVFRRRLCRALARIADARSLADAQFALGRPLSTRRRSPWSAAPIQCRARQLYSPTTSSNSRYPWISPNRNESLELHRQK